MTKMLLAEDRRRDQGNLGGWIRLAFPQVHFAKAIEPRSGDRVCPWLVGAE